MTETEARDISSVYGAMASWFTPSYLFIFINLVIGTIAITSRFTTTTPKRQHNLNRSPSLLHRFTSFNFRYHKHETTTTLTPHNNNVVVEPVQTQDSPRPVQISSFDTTETGEEDEVKSNNSPLLDRVPSSSLLDRIRSFSFGRTESERSEPVQNPESGMNLVRSPSLLSRGPSFLQRLKSLTFERSEFEAEVRDGGVLVEEREEGVDAKADDFINRFRQQLRLQRLDSILRCRDMLRRN